MFQNVPLKPFIKQGLGYWAVACLLVVPILWLLYNNKSAADLEMIKANDKHTINLVEQTVTTEFEFLITEIGYLADLTNDHLQNEPNHTLAMRDIAFDLATFAKRQPRYEQVRYLDQSGHERIRINRSDNRVTAVPSTQLQDKSDRYYFKKSRTLANNSVYISPFDLNVENGAIEIPHKPMLRIATPVFDGAGNHRGVIVLNISGQYILDKIRNFEQKIYGNIWLVNNKGYWLLGDHPENEWGFMFNDQQPESLSLKQPDSWQKILQAQGKTQFSNDTGLYSTTKIELSRSDTVHWDDALYLIAFTPTTLLHKRLDEHHQSLIPAFYIFFFLTLTASLAASYFKQREHIHAQHALDVEQYANKIRKLNQKLHRHSKELEAINGELEAFSYSVSHDLRGPLRAMDGFSLTVLKDYGELLDERGRDRLQRIRNSAQRMGELIDDLLNLSRITRKQVNWDEVNLSQLAHDTVKSLKEGHDNRSVNISIEDKLVVHGDDGLLRVVLDNLIGNAWKFTSTKESANIEFGSIKEADKTTYFVRDNGAGFDMQFANKLFSAFQRLHDTNEFPGTGIGLATVQRIIHKHGGRIWAEGEINQGATFYFTLDGYP